MPHIQLNRGLSLDFSGRALGCQEVAPLAYTSQPKAKVLLYVLGGLTCRERNVSEVVSDSGDIRGCCIWG